MSKVISLTIAGALISIASMIIGAGIAFLYLGKPMQEWSTEHTEASLTWQSEALQRLRSGEDKSALQYLEFVAAQSINGLSERKASGENVPATYSSVQAIRYLCANPPVIFGATTKLPPSVSNACAILEKHPSPSK